MPPPVSDRYRLEMRLGRDDDVEEWLATDTSLDRPVLIRSLGPESTPERRRQFVESVSNAAKTSHSHLARVFAVSQVDGGVARDVAIFEGEMPAGTHTGLHAHQGDEHHIILSGRVRFSQGEHTVEAGPGDYVLLDGTLPHDVETLGDEPARLILVYPRDAHSRLTREAVADEG